MTVKLPEFKEAFSRLIATPSVSSLDAAFDQSNKPAVELLAGWFADLGFAVELMPVSTGPEKVNLIASIGSGDGGLVLSGHTDTVPYNEAAWEQDPFVLTERDGRFYGLGSTDMKCFFPIVMETLKEMDISNIRQPLFVLATSDEESTMAGAKAIVSAGRKLGRYALIGEPTGLKPINMHKGVMLESIKLIGRAGHSSDPERGLNAMEGMHDVITRMQAWRDGIQDRYQNPAFKIPIPTLNFGSIHGGDNPNRICETCELQIDFRLLPKMLIEDVRAELRQTVMQAIDGRGFTVEFDSIFPGLPSLETDRDSEIIKIAERLTGATSDTVAFATEGPFLNSIGMDTVILGPGNIEQAHQANEYVDIDQIKPMQIILQNMIHHFCM